VVMVALGFYLCMCVWVLKEGRAELSGLLNKFGGGVSGERIFELEDFLASDLWEWQIYLVDLRMGNGWVWHGFTNKK
jgi:hypothetical protein